MEQQELLSSDTVEWNRESTLDTWLNEPSEVHAMWIGFCTIFLGIDVHKVPQKNLDEIENEYPYYLMGKALAIGAILCVAIFLI
ncbi:hypothetical protein [Bacteroides sp.]|uniref:hypothetical protein n=1 Tax=Bacteroides sp. TaxID=29523 RepID=UPI0026319EA4|nr:hypothetical protein [Bacteroides sp.]MDD3039591.1 hypothetical protein [Bacteroides sp.]